MSSDWQYVPGEGILRPHTIRCRRGVLERFWAWMEARDLGPDDLEIRLLERWVQGRLREISAASIVTESRAVRAWLKRERKDLADRWRDEMVLPRFTSPEPRALTEDEDARVMVAVRAHPGFILVALCRYAGLRIDEAETLLRDSITRVQGRSIIRIQPVPEIGWEPKGHKIRDVPIMEKLDVALREEEDRHDCIWVAARYHHGQWGRWRKRPWRLAALIQAAGELPKGMAFHCLRRTFATRLRERDVPLEVIQRIIGHVDINTTRNYIDSTRLGDVDFIELAG